MNGTGFCFVGAVPGVEGCPPGLRIRQRNLRPADDPAGALPPEPDHLRRPAHGHRGNRILRRQSRHRNDPLAGNDQLQPGQLHPERDGEADDRGGGLALRARHARCACRRRRAPITPSPSELKTAKITLPPGFSINTGAADGKIACPDVLSAIGTRLDRDLPGDRRRSGRSSSTSPALPAPLPGALYLAEPKPGEPYRVLLAASGFATNVKLLGTVQTDPVRPARSRSSSRTCRSRRCRNSTSTSSAPNAACWRRRATAGPTTWKANSCPGTPRWPSVTRRA